MYAIGTLLEEHGLAKTSQRMEVLKVFIKNPAAITHNNLERELGKDFDRSTIYRILNSFQEKGLIHKIMSPSGEARYAMCSSHCDAHTHQDTHVHFSCNNCENVYCLNEVEVPQLKLPKGFQFSSFNYMAEGLCENCLPKAAVGKSFKKLQSR